MASKLFKNEKAVKTVTNRAGGKAVGLSDKETLAKYVVTCTFNDTYYATGKEHLDELKSTIDSISDNDFLAKCAIYSRETAGMKDMPAYMLNVLYDRDRALFAKIFNRVIDSGRMLRTFVQVARSPYFKRNLSARAMRRVFQEWFDKNSSGWLFSNSLGNDPSFADIVKMTHVKAGKHQDLFAYFLDKEYNEANLPNKLQDYLAWKRDRSRNVPDVNFRMLDSEKLSTEEWASVLKSCSWNTLRMNLATFSRHNVFDKKENLKFACEKLESEMPKNVFPYEVFAAYKMNKNNLKLSNSLNEVMEKSVENLPTFKGRTIIAIDNSSSMSSALSDKSSISCADVAAMFGACIARNSENCTVLTFMHRVNNSYKNPKMSILTFAEKLSNSCGGTSIASVLDYIKNQGIEFDNLVIVSDCESWEDDSYTSGSFDSMWEKMCNGKKLISIDLAPSAYTNASTKRKNNLFVGGFNDSVWTVIKNFLENSENFTCQIDKVVV